MVDIPITSPESDAIAKDMKSVDSIFSAQPFAMPIFTLPVSSMTTSTVVSANENTKKQFKYC